MLQEHLRQLVLAAARTLPEGHSPREGVLVSLDHANTFVWIESALEQQLENIGAVMRYRNAKKPS